VRIPSGAVDVILSGAFPREDLIFYFLKVSQFPNSVVLEIQESKPDPIDFILIFQNSNETHIKQVMVPVT